VEVLVIEAKEPGAYLNVLC